MSKIIVFSESKKLKAYFAPVELDFKSENVEVLMAAPSDKLYFDEALAEIKNLIIVEYSLIEGAPSLLNKIFGRSRASLIMAVDFQKVGDRLWGFKELCSSNTLVEGVIDTSREIQFFYPLIRSILRRNSSLESSLGSSEMGKDLNKMIQMTLSELEKVKKLHRQLVPMRSDEVKPVSLVSKFAAGISAGGDFFDIVKSDSSLIFLLTTSQSYVVSSIILSHFEKLQKVRLVSQEILEDFLEELTDEARLLELIDRENPKLLELLLVHIDLRSLKFEAYRFGGALIVSSSSGISLGNSYPLDEPYYEKARFEGRLERGEKWTIISSGLARNLPKGVQGKSIEDYITAEIEKKPRELIDEVFFQLKRKTEGELLKHDASLVLVEVDSNAITQI